MYDEKFGKDKLGSDVLYSTTEFYWKVWDGDEHAVID